MPHAGSTRIAQFAKHVNAICTQFLKKKYRGEIMLTWHYIIDAHIICSIRNYHEHFNNLFDMRIHNRM